MTLTRKACLEVCCCSFEGYSDEASAGTGPEIKSTSVIGTQLCRKGFPGGSSPNDPPAGKVYAFDEFEVQVLSVTRGVPSWSGSVWTVPVDFDLRFTATCSDCSSPLTEDVTVSEEFKVYCDDSTATEKFEIEKKVRFATETTTVCGGFPVSVGWQDTSPRIEGSVEASAISGKGCAAYDQVVFTVNVPITASNPGPSTCQDVTEFNFPASTSSGACVLTMEWSLLSP